MESLGVLAAPRIVDLWRAVKTSSRAALEVVTRSVRNGREVSVRSGLSYTPYDPAAEISSEPSDLFLPDGTARGPISQFNVPVAAGLCGDKKPTLPVDGISGAKGVPYASCAELGAAQRFIAAILKVPEPPLPTCETTRTTLSALRLSGIPLLLRSQSGGGAPTDDKLDGETLLLATLPGEPVTRLADALRKKSPAGADRTFVIGYAQGHIGYLLDVENWLRGGYEPSINIFGPLEGEWLLERSLDLLRLVHTPEREDAEAPGVGGPPQGGRFDRLQFLPRSLHTVPRSPTTSSRSGSHQHSFRSVCADPWESSFPSAAGRAAAACQRSCHVRVLWRRSRRGLAAGQPGVRKDAWQWPLFRGSESLWPRGRESRS
jgi:hypothetical protein